MARYLTVTRDHDFTETSDALGSRQECPPRGGADGATAARASREPTPTGYADGAYYTRVISGGSMVYQVVAPPVGVVIATLPAGCSSVRVGGIAYSRCGPTYYQRVGGGYQVVVLR